MFGFPRFVAVVLVACTMQASAEVVAMPGGAAVANKNAETFAGTGTSTVEQESSAPKTSSEAVTNIELNSNQAKGGFAEENAEMSKITEGTHLRGSTSSTHTSSSASESDGKAKSTVPVEGAEDKGTFDETAAASESLDQAKMIVPEESTKVKNTFEATAAVRESVDKGGETKETFEATFAASESGAETKGAIEATRNAGDIVKAVSGSNVSATRFWGHGIFGETCCMCSRQDGHQTVLFAAEDYSFGFGGTHTAFWRCRNTCSDYCWAKRGRMFGCYSEDDLMLMENLYRHRTDYRILHSLFFGNIC